MKPPVEEARTGSQYDMAPYRRLGDGGGDEEIWRLPE